MKKIKFIFIHAFFIAVCSIIGCIFITQLHNYFVKKEELNKFFLNEPEYQLAKAVLLKNNGEIKRLCKKNPEWIKRSFEEKYYSVLQYAVSNGQTKSVGALLAAGMNPNVVDYSDETPIFTAVDQLYAMVNKIDYSKIVHLLIKYGADCNFHKKENLEKTGITNGGETPLMRSTYFYGTKYQKILIETGHADINDKTKYGVTAAVTALWMGNIKGAHYLIAECKADVTEPFYFYDEKYEWNKIQIYPVMLVKVLKNYPEDSENYKLMQEIIAEFINQGIDDFESPVPDDVFMILNEHCSAIHLTKIINH